MSNLSTYLQAVKAFSVLAIGEWPYKNVNHFVIIVVSQKGISDYRTFSFVFRRERFWKQGTFWFMVLIFVSNVLKIFFKLVFFYSFSGGFVTKQVWMCFFINYIDQMLTNYTSVSLITVWWWNPNVCKPLFYNIYFSNVISEYRTGKPK